MLEIIQDTEDLIELSNGKISLKFFKSGPSQGFFEVIFNNKNSLNECYCNILFHDDDSYNLKEIKSTQTSYVSHVDKIETAYGIGFKLSLTPFKKDHIDVFFRIQIQLYDNQDFFLVSLDDIEDRSKNKRSVHSISPLTIKNSKLWLNGLKSPTNLEKITWFKNGFQSWSPCNLFFGTERDVMGPTTEVLNLTFDNQDYHIQGRFYSEYVTVITDLTNNNSLIMGFITNKDQFTRLVMDYENAIDLKLLSAFGCMDGVKFYESTINSSETLFVGFKAQDQGYYGLIDYSKMVKSSIKKPLITKIPVGWCSWYYYFTEITESEMIANMNFFVKNNNIQIDFIQLDDGYFTKIGDYLNIDQEKFPRGLEYLFSLIKKNGFKIGIWTAPFFAVRLSNLFKNHRDWFLTKNKKLLKVHFNWNSFQYALDLTKDEVLNYLSELYDKFYHITKDLRMDFFKIDFLHAAVPYGADYTKKSYTRAQLLRLGIKKVRDAISYQSYLLGCGAPLGPCIGLVDGMRISGDTAPIWDAGFTEKYANNKGIENTALKGALVNILYRSFMHNYFWINDPDCLMVRRKNTKLTLDEIQLQLTIFGLSGGQLLISDDMTKLSQDEINDAKLLLPPYNPHDFDPLVLDAFQSPLPTIYSLETNEIINHRFLVAIINWNDNYESKNVKILELLGKNLEVDKNYLVFSFWDKKYLGLFKLNETLKLPKLRPHSCAYLSLIPVNKNYHKEVIFISSNLHISQGCYEIRTFEYLENSSKILFKIRVSGKRIGTIYLKIPHNKKVIGYENNYEKVNDQDNIWKFDVEVEDERIMEIMIS